MKGWLAMAMVLALSLAQWSGWDAEDEYGNLPPCPNNSPVLRRPPELAVSITPEVQTNDGGQLSFRVELKAGEGYVAPNNLPSLQGRVRLSGRVGEQQQLPVTLQQQGRLLTGRLNVTPEYQGVVTLEATKFYCSRSTSFSPPELRTVRQEATAMVFVPHIGNSTARVRAIIDEEWRYQQQQTLEIMVLADNLEPQLREVLSQVAKGGHDCGSWGCRVIPPAKQVRSYSGLPSELRALIARGIIQGSGFYGGTFRRDGRLWALEELFDDSFALILMEGNRHSYIIYGPGLVIEDREIVTLEAPRGMSSVLREALMLALIEQEAREVH